MAKGVVASGFEGCREDIEIDMVRIKRVSDVCPSEEV